MSDNTPTPRDRIADILDHDRKWPDASETADAIIAALSDMIEPLVWGWECDFNCTELFIAKTSFGQYSAYATAECKAGYYVELEEGALFHSSGPWDTMDEAKSAAQKHLKTMGLALFGLTHD